MNSSNFIPLQTNLKKLRQRPSSCNKIIKVQMMLSCDIIKYYMQNNDIKSSYRQPETTLNLTK
jgi:hypothetical protein